MKKDIQKQRFIIAIGIFIITIFTIFFLIDWIKITLLFKKASLEKLDYNEIITEGVVVCLGLLLVVSLVVIFIVRINSSYQRNFVLIQDRLNVVLKACIVRCDKTNEMDIKEISDEFVKIFGYDSGDLKECFNNSFVQLISPPDRCAVLSILKENTEIRNVKCQMYTKYGEVSFKVLVALEDNKKDEYLLYLFDITECQKMEDNNHFNIEKYEAINSLSSNIVFEYDIVNDILRLNNDNNHFFDNHIYYKFCDDVTSTAILSHKDTKIILESIEKIKNLELGSINFDIEIAFPEKRPIVISILGTTICDKNKTPITCLGYVIIKEEVEKQDFLYNQSHLQKILGNNAGVYVINLSDNEIVSHYRNGEIINDHGKVSYEEYFKKMANDTIVTEDYNIFLSFYNCQKIITRYMRGKDIMECEYRCIQDTGKVIWVKAIITVSPDEINGKLYAYITINNIDDLKIQNYKILHEVDHDYLTDLYNRKICIKNIDSFLAMNPGYSKHNYHGFIMLDIDNFKIINDKFGHIMGDNVLVKVSDILRKSFRSTDIISRFGGDEFVVFIPNNQQIYFIEDKIRLLLDNIRNINDISGFDDKITISVGIAVSPVHGITFDELYEKADKALYIAKNSGKNRYEIYNK